MKPENTIGYRDYADPRLQPPEDNGLDDYLESEAERRMSDFMRESRDLVAEAVTENDDALKAIIHLISTCDDELRQVYRGGVLDTTQTPSAEQWHALAKITRNTGVLSEAVAEYLEPELKLRIQREAGHEAEIAEAHRKNPELAAEYL